MDLGEWVARKILEGFNQFKPESIVFEGQNLMLVYRTTRSLERLTPNIQILIGSKEGYRINAEELVILEKNRKKRLEEELVLLGKKIDRKTNSREVPFTEYYGGDIQVTDQNFYVSSTPLNANKDVIYKRIAVTSNGNAIKVVPYRNKNGEMVALECIYILERQHKEDSISQLKISRKSEEEVPRTFSISV